MLSIETNFGRRFLIYRIYDKNNKSYIGATRDIKARVRQYNYEYRTKKNIQRNGASKAMKEQGIENFAIEILEECSTFKEVKERENYYIDKYNSIIDGYNEYEMSSLSENRIGRPQSEEEKNKKSKPLFLIENGLPIPFKNSVELGKYLELDKSNITRAARHGIRVRDCLVIFQDPIILKEIIDKMEKKIKEGKYKKESDLTTKRIFLGYCKLILEESSVEVIPQGSTG